MYLRLICYQNKQRQRQSKVVKSIDSETRLPTLKLSQTLSSSLTLNEVVSLSVPLFFLIGIVKSIVPVTLVLYEDNYMS